VVWEVELEPESVAKLNGAFVGFLAEHKDTLAIQQIFFMDGFQNIKVSPLGSKNGHRSMFLISGQSG
ncbi:hypothetical protein A2U01_0067930, partial [Trifolium medium]|nr:hypothetical protein [Trifolium medium]